MARAGMLGRMRRRLIRASVGVARGGLDLLLPASCAGCRSADSVVAGLCAPCRARLRSAAPVAWFLDAPGGAKVAAYAAARYEGGTREIVLAYKERGRQALRGELGRSLLVACLAAAADGLFATSVWLVPVPSRPATVRARGHDAVRAVAGVAARELRRLGVQAWMTPALRHTRAVADQAGLAAAARAANLAGALGVRPAARLRGRVVVVVDDIVTTGATAVEAVRAAASAGALVTAVVAIAATPKRAPAESSGDVRTDAARAVTARLG